MFARHSGHSFACSACHPAFSTFVENSDSGDDIVFFFVVALTEDPTRFGRNLATLGAG